VDLVVNLVLDPLVALVFDGHGGGHGGWPDCGSCDGPVGGACGGGDGGGGLRCDTEPLLCRSMFPAYNLPYLSMCLRKYERCMI
jgi:hypothetical protein